MKNNVLRLSRNFWDFYKLFLQGKFTRKELEKYLETPDDAIFYQQNCNHRFNVDACLEKMTEQQVDMLVERIALELEKSSPTRQRKILKAMVFTFLDEIVKGKRKY